MYVVHSKLFHSLVLSPTALVARIFGQLDKQKTYDRTPDLLSLHDYLNAPVNSYQKDAFHVVYSVAVIEHVSDLQEAWNSVDLVDKGLGNLAPLTDSSKVWTWVGWHKFYYVSYMAKKPENPILKTSHWYEDWVRLLGYYNCRVCIKGQIVFESLDMFYTSLAGHSFHQVGNGTLWVSESLSVLDHSIHLPITAVCVGVYGAMKSILNPGIMASFIL